MRLFFALAVAVIAAAPLAAQELPAPLAAELDRARADCAGFEAGQFTLEDGAVSRVDLDGDGAPDWVLYSRFFSWTLAIPEVRLPWKLPVKLVCPKI